MHHATITSFEFHYISCVCSLFQATVELIADQRNIAPQIYLQSISSMAVLVLARKNMFIKQTARSVCVNMCVRSYVRICRALNVYLLTPSPPSSSPHSKKTTTTTIMHSKYSIQQRADKNNTKYPNAVLFEANANEMSVIPTEQRQRQQPPSNFCWEHFTM